MRSGNGDKVIVRLFASLIFITALYGELLAKEYLLSYDYTVKNAIIYNEKLLISPAMTKCKGKPTGKPLLLPYDANSDKNDFRSVVTKHFDRFFAYLATLGFAIHERSTTQNFQNTSTAHLEFPTTCFKVDFNDSFVTITAIKQGEKR